MMKNYKIGIKLLKYGYGIKQNVVCTMLFIVAGFLFIFFIPENFAGMFYLSASALCLVQILYSLNATAMVNSTSRRKALCTSVPVLLCLPLQLIFYGVGSLGELLMLYMGKVQEQYLAWDMIILGGAMLVFEIFIAGAYKFFMVSVVMACVGLFAFVFGGDISLRIVSPDIPLGAAIVIGLAEILLGACLQYLLSLLLYRHPISKAAQMWQLQKYM